MESKMMKAGEIGTVYGDTTLGRDRKVVFKYLKGFWMADMSYSSGQYGDLVLN